MTAILGIGGFSHDSAAALLCDGRIVGAAMEERFTRRKHQGGMPYQAVAWLLEHAGLTRDDLTAVGVYMRPSLRMWRRVCYRLSVAHKSPRHAAAYIGYEVLHNWAFMRQAHQLCGRRTKLHYLEHHPMHAASAFFCSPFEQAVILSLDYIGEFACSAAFVGRGNRQQRVWQCCYPQSLGVVYSALTDYLGFERANDEYKVMGLAGYGDPLRYKPVFDAMIQSRDDLGYHIDLSYFQYHYLPGSRLGYVSPALIAALGPPREREGPLEQRHMDVAAALQARLEEVVLDLARALHRRHPDIPNLCLAGGVALNSVLNGRLLAQGPFSQLYVQPAAGDDGIALGAALHIHHELLGHPRDPVPLHDACLGPAYDDAEIETALRAAGVRYRRCDDVTRDAATRIAEGRIVGWFQGRMEFGPRALGARSILADATRPEMQDVLNARVKHREDFRPFAPAVCVEDYDTYFEPPRQGLSAAEVEPYRFMLLVSSVKPKARAQLPAITHVDGTARVQTVDRERSPLLYRLLREIEKLRGAPVVVNTSFNVRGEPIVCTPEDAIRCFLGTGIDVLFLGPFEVTKEDTPT